MMSNSTQDDWQTMFLEDDNEDSINSDTSDDSDYEETSMRCADSDSEDQSGPAIHISNTRFLRDHLSGTLSEKVHKVLMVMDGLGINLPLFLDGLSWGDAGCISDPKIQYEKTALMTSEELPRILRRWWKPPKPTGSRKPRPKGAKGVMEDFASQCTQSILDRELEAVAEYLLSPVGEDIKEENLTSVVFDKMIESMKRVAPNLWQSFRALAYTPEQEARNKKKNPDKIVLMVISMLSYTRSHHRSRFQKLFSIYLKFRGLSAKAFDTLHALALTMSHKWTGNAVGRISKKCMEEVVALMHLFPWLISYDNINIAFRVFSQRLDNKDECGSGSATTVYIKRNVTPLATTANRNLQEFRAEGIDTKGQ